MKSYTLEEAVRKIRSNNWEDVGDIVEYAIEKKVDIFANLESTLNSFFKDSEGSSQGDDSKPPTQ